MENTINIDNIEKKYRWRFLVVIFLLPIFSVLINFLLLKNGHKMLKAPGALFAMSFLAIIYGLYTFLAYVIKCPYCHKNYFPKKIYSRNDFKKTIKSTHSCSNCSEKAILQSRFLELL